MSRHSIRLTQIIKFIPPYRKIADIGCDHGYLVLDCFNNNLIDFAMLVDNKIYPLESAKNNLKDIDNNKYELSLSNGIDNITNNIDCVLILGMGGINICNILDNKDKLKDVKRLILQPNNNTYLVRKKLNEIGFKIVDEAIIHDYKYYEIIICEKGDEKYSELELKYGPINIKSKNKEFIDYIKFRIDRLKKVEDVDKVINEIKEMEELL